MNRNQALEIWPVPGGRKWPDFMDGHEKIQLYEAACLFFDNAPILPMPARSQKLFDEWKMQWLANYPNRLPVLVQRGEAVAMAIDSAHGEREKTFHPHMEVYRKDLVKWCETHGERPRFCSKISGAKKMNLKQAIKEGKLEEFAAEHQVQDAHPEGESQFWRLLKAMLGLSASGETSDAERDEGSDDTQTPQDTSEDV